ncbi:hypothetical protein CR194_17985 [Salipaludibacillus keqinensis]|uniref:Uncharacterized protein n=1 Tax=Salipaludibacillus keqinensis TaxID=2045207 RepID=A0A323T892_9BACI|nr:hypothetical protein [Salipaludibacillus keqinensis]PYZ92082.1 hypothetical protein CR194_17985 [Salipaludibacillus keqinensis]
MKDKLCTFSLLAVLMLAACGSNDKELIGGNDQEFPYNYISETFRYGGFDYPEDWEVAGISSDVQLSYRDANNPEDHRYSETPYRYSFTFGRRASSNEVSKEHLEEYNQNQALNEETHRQLFYHTYYDHYANLSLSSNGFTHVLMEYDEVEHWKIDEEDVMVLRYDNEWRANWINNGVYYDLHVKREAYKDNEEEMMELLQRMIRP